MCKRLLFILTSLLISYSAFADFDRGLAAYNQGDYATAYREFRADAGQGHAKAQSALGLMYDIGRGVPQNDAEAVRWYRLAAEQGDAPAQYNLGLMYDTGQGVIQSDAEAARWYRLAAEQGLLGAQIKLGVMYSSGRGVTQNDAEAVRWYRRSAEQGDVYAQFKLGVMYAKGIGIPKNMVFAYMWSSIAAAQGDPSARHNLGIAEEQMTRQQIAEAQSLAAAFKPQQEILSTPTAPSTTHTHHPEEAKLTGTGSGFFVTQHGHVLTNHHVIEGCEQIRIALPQGSFNARRIAEHEGDDLALLHADVTPPAVASFRRSPPALGEDVSVAGYPLRGLLSGMNLTTGSVSSTTGVGGDARYLQITAPVQPGNSGGPLLDSDGAVVGVVVAKLDAMAVARLTGDIPQNVNFAIKSAIARSFLSIHDITYSESGQRKNKNRVMIGAEAQRHTVLVECWQ